MTYSIFNVWELANRQQASFKEDAFRRKVHIERENQCQQEAAGQAGATLDDPRRSRFGAVNAAVVRSCFCHD
jgi:hypothetical protein